jgi:hypothetical protein
MENFTISDYLSERDKAKNQGKCKLCQKNVYWTRNRVASHKRSSCPAASDEEKRKFAKRSATSLNASGGNNSIESEDDEKNQNAECANCNLSAEKIKVINSLFGAFFYRTGISLRLADSNALKNLMKEVNPAYAAVMPSAKVLAGSLLDQQFGKCSAKIEEILESCESLTLISDGWTNIRGDHIVNYCVKAPNQKPFFHSAVNTSGIAQNAAAVCDAIASVIEKLGPAKFNLVITDNAPVMKAAWKLIQEKFPHISANGCSAHGMNLLLKDILNIAANKATKQKAEKIIKFISNHHAVKAKYEEKRAVAKIPHTLSMSVSTRWFSSYTSMNDLLTSKFVVMQLVDDHKEMLLQVSPKENSSAAVKLMKSSEFWEQLAELVKSIEFPANIIGKIRFNR